MGVSLCCLLLGAGGGKGRSLGYACQENAFSQVLDDPPLQAKKKTSAELGSPLYL